MSDTAHTAAEERFEEDMLALRSYIETEEGRQDTTNAGVLGRLLLHAHTRLDNLDVVLDRIGSSLEKVVAPKLHELRQLPERVATIEERITALERQRTIPDGIGVIDTSDDGLGG